MGTAEYVVAVGVAWGTTGMRGEWGVAGVLGVVAVWEEVPWATA